MKTVGKKYVTIDTSYEKKYEAVDANYLYEYTDYGERTLLFQTKQEAEDYIEVHRLAIWLAGRRSNDWSSCTHSTRTHIINGRVQKIVPD